MTPLETRRLGPYKALRIMKSEDRYIARYSAVEQRRPRVLSDVRLVTSKTNRVLLPCAFLF